MAASSKAVNNRDRNFTRGKVERRRAQLEESVGRYLSQLDTADRQEPSEALAAKAKHLKEKLAKLDEEMAKLAAYEKRMLASPDQQISLTDPDSRSMATSGRGSGVVGYNVQVAVDTEHHLIVTHEVTNVGNDTSQLAHMAEKTKAVLQVEKLEAVADRGYINSEEILTCDQAGITVTLLKPMTSGSKSEGRFGKQDFVYVPEEDVYWTLIAASDRRASPTMTQGWFRSNIWKKLVKSPLSRDNRRIAARRRALRGVITHPRPGADLWPQVAEGHRGLVQFVISD